MADLRKPVFFSTEASILGCTKLADNLFQYDEVEVAPAEIVNGLGVMPPEYSFGKYQIWSNTYTLGMTGTAGARPVFYSADITDLNDILVGVNTIAARLGSPLQTDPNDGRTWLESISEVYVHAVDATATSGSTTGIISSGLIAELDASYVNSYSGTGTVWTDLTGNGHNGIVTGSYNSSIASGVFEFDTQGEFIEFSQPITKSELSLTVNSELTYQAWVYVPQHTAQSTLFGKGTQTYLQGNYGMNLFTKNNQSDSFSIISDGSQQGQFSTGQPGGTWQLITFQAFVGVPNEQLSPSHSWYNTDRVLTRHYFNDTVRMNANYPSLDYYVNSGQPNTAAEVGELDVLKDNGYTASNLKIGALYIYNKILTAQEVADNYNNTKTRFGL